MIIAALFGRFYLSGGRQESSLRHFHVAERLYHEGKIELATSEMEQALVDDPRRVEVRDALGTLYQLQDRRDDELKTYRAGIALMPDDPRMYYALGMAYYASNRYAEATEQVRNCIRLVPDEAQYT